MVRLVKLNCDHAFLVIYVCLLEFKGREWLVSGTVVSGSEGASEHIKSLAHYAWFPPFAHKFAGTCLTAINYPHLVEMLATCT